MDVQISHNLMTNQRPKFINDFAIHDQLSALISKVEAKSWSDKYEILSKLGKIIKELINKANQIIPENEPDSKYNAKHVKTAK